MFFCYLKQAYAFLILKTRSLACCAEWDKNVYTGVNLTIHQRSKGIIIHLRILERRQKSSSTS